MKDAIKLIIIFVVCLAIGAKLHDVTGNAGFIVLVPALLFWIFRKR